MPTDLVGALTAMLTRTAPVLGFLALVTVVAELADEAGLFAVSGHRAARLAGGSVRRLLLLVCGLAVLTTTTLSLDSTVVLLTPVALTLVGQLDLPPRPFLYACVWFANGASLVLPIANLTNLLAQERLGLSTADYLHALWLPQLAVIVVTTTALLVRHRRVLAGRYAVPREAPVHDRVLVRAAAAATLVIGVATLTGLEAWEGAALALALLAGAFAVRDRRVLAPARLLRMVPWVPLAQTLGLFVVVTLSGPLLHPLVSTLVGGTSDGLGSMLRTGLGGAVVGNLLNNLPAYLLLEPAAEGNHVMALLVGVGVGPQILLWGSVANLLWADRLRARGHRVTLAGFAREGLVVVPPALLLGLAALAVGAAG